MTFRVWIKHDDGAVDTLLVAGGGRTSLIIPRLIVDAKREALTRGWNRPIVIKVRETVSHADYEELPVQTRQIIKDLMAQGM